MSQPEHSSAGPDRLPLGAYLKYGAVVVVAGVAAIAAVWLFSTVYTGLNVFLYHSAAPAMREVATWAPALIPAIGGALIVLLVDWLRGKQPVPGLGNVIYAVADDTQSLRVRRGLVYTLGAVLSLGVGVPVGEDTPSAMVGAHTASWLGSRLRQPDRAIEALVAMGAAAGIAFAYDAQLAGVIFALEVVLGGFGGWYYTIPVLVGAGLSTTLALFAGDRLQTFMLPAQVVTGLPPEAVALGAIVALTGACAGLAFLKILAAAQPLLIRTPLPPVARAALVGGIVGIAGLFLPRVLGTGIHEVQLLFGGSAQEIGALLALLLARTLLTPLCLKNGFIGGIIGPSLAIGAAIGYVCAQAGGYLLPGVTVAPALFAMLGAAAVLSAVSHAPVFAAIFIFETTGDARLIAPLLLVSAIAFYVSRHFQATSAYTEAFTAWGLRVQPGRNRIVDLTPSASDPTL